MLDADYRPPVKRGDLALVPSEARIVGIIDGVLLNDAAVGHREILALLEKGVRVLGGGSMGALRAAELADYGMLGVGDIFEEYRTGRVEGDDEVVLAYDPFTQRPLSEPMINLRLNLRRAEEENIIAPASARRLLEAVKRTYFPQRSYDLLIKLAKKDLPRAEFEGLQNYIKNEAVDFKKKDAISLLRAVNNFL